jgi:hypothetical protein
VVAGSRKCGDEREAQRVRVLACRVAGHSFDEVEVHEDPHHVPKGGKPIDAVRPLYRALFIYPCPLLPILSVGAWTGQDSIEAHINRITVPRLLAGRSGAAPHNVSFTPLTSIKHYHLHRVV